MKGPYIYDEPVNGNIWYRAGLLCHCCPPPTELAPWGTAYQRAAGFMLCQRCGSLSVPDPRPAQVEVDKRVAVALERIATALEGKSTSVEEAFVVDVPESTNTEGT